MSWEDGETPAGWKLAELGEVTQVVGGGTPNTTIGSNFSESSGHPWITPSDLTGYTDIYISRGRRFLTDQGLAGSSAKIIPAGSVLFSTRAPIGHVAIAANPVTTNQGFRSFIPSPEIDPEYLYFTLRFLRPIAQQRASGTTFPELSGSKAALLPIAYPCLDEQRAIARCLQTIDRGARAAATHSVAARQAVAQFRQALLVAASTGRLTTGWREARGDDETGTQRMELVNSERASLGGDGRQSRRAPATDLDDLPELPSTWTWSTCEGIVKPNRALTYGVIKLGEPVPDGVPTLRSSDVRHLRIDTSHIKRIDSTISDNYRRTVLEGGEIVVTVRGSLGGVAAVPKELAGYNVSREVAVIPVVDSVDTKFYAYVIAGRQSQEWLGEVSKGVTYTGINIEDLRRLPVPVPPLMEQREIVRRLEELLVLTDRVTRHTEEVERKAATVSQAILFKAFHGELIAYTRGSRDA